MACQVGGIAICTIVAKNYMSTTASKVGFRVARVGLSHGHRRGAAVWPAFPENESEKCAESIRKITVVISGLMISWVKMARLMN
ncbi:hypothetical protein [Burkholderia sp. ABCPW 11]|uniref:hypothetical protein n=1 Tax=Burkholderia sp. ABCPW 11 TaxID=1637859 RepID=UPI0012FD745C|nr:hypothetical protein [Burkholderia sp. ABCPW 11]